MRENCALTCGYCQSTVGNTASTIGTGTAGSGTLLQPVNGVGLAPSTFTYTFTYPIVNGGGTVVPGGTVPAGGAVVSGG